MSGEHTTGWKLGVALLVGVAVCSLAAGNARAAGGTGAPALGAADRRAIDSLLDRFVPAAIARDDVSATYGLVTSQLRQGMTKKQWASGNIPVYPFAARGTRFHAWSYDYRQANAVFLHLLLHSRNPRAHVRAISFAIEVQKLHGRWLVASVVPAALYGAGITSSSDYGPSATGGGAPPGKAGLGRFFIVIPLAALGLAPLIGLGYVLVSWRRERRAMRRIGTQLPKLPERESPTSSSS